MRNALFLHLLVFGTILAVAAEDPVNCSECSEWCSVISSLANSSVVANASVEVEAAATAAEKPFPNSVIALAPGPFYKWSCVPDQAGKFVNTEMLWHQYCAFTITFFAALGAYSFLELRTYEIGMNMPSMVYGQLILLCALRVFAFMVDPHNIYGIFNPGWSVVFIGMAFPALCGAYATVAMMWLDMYKTIQEASATKGKSVFLSHYKNAFIAMIIFQWVASTASDGISTHFPSTSGMAQMFIRICLGLFIVWGVIVAIIMCKVLWGIRNEKALDKRTQYKITERVKWLAFSATVAAVIASGLLSFVIFGNDIIENSPYKFLGISWSVRIMELVYGFMAAAAVPRKIPVDGNSRLSSQRSMLNSGRSKNSKHTRKASGDVPSSVTEPTKKRIVEAPVKEKAGFETPLQEKAVETPLQEKAADMPLLEKTAETPKTIEIV